MHAGVRRRQATLIPKQSTQASLQLQLLRKQPALKKRPQQAHLKKASPLRLALAERGLALLADTPPQMWVPHRVTKATLGEQEELDMHYSSQCSAFD